jgi:hypothetical protein
MTEETKDNEETSAAVAPAAPALSDDTLNEEDLNAIDSIKERLKFFFSNANVRQDLFVRKLLTQSDDKGVPVEVMLRFNTIKKLTEKPTVLMKAAKDLSDLLVVDEEKSIIRRVVPFTKEMMNENIPLSLRVTNIPIKTESSDGGEIYKKYDVSVDEIRELFEKYGDVALVKLQFEVDRSENDSKKTESAPSKATKGRKYPSGVALIEYRKKEDLEKAADATLTIKQGEKVEPKEKVILEATDYRSSPVEVEVMLLSEFLRGNKKGARREKDLNHSRKRDRETVADEEDNEPTQYTVDWKPGCVIKLRGLPESCDREAILDCLATGLGISTEDVKSRKIYADFSRGQTDGAIRFPEPSESIADLAERLTKGELKIQDTKVQVVLLDGDEEKKYWDDFIAFKTNQIVKRQEEKREKKKNKKWRSR